MKIIYYLFTLLLVALPSECFGQANCIEPGSGRFVFRDPLGNKDKPITVWYYLPKAVDTNLPVVFVMHGVNRNGQEYRDAWIKYAEQEKFLLLVLDSQLLR